MIYVTMSLDLQDGDDVRQKVYNQIQGKAWQKLESVDTVWVKQYSGYAIQTPDSVRQIVADVSRTLIDCAKEHKLRGLTYITQIGNSPVFERKIVKDPQLGYQDRAF